MFAVPCQKGQRMKKGLVLVTEGSEDLEAVTTIDVLRRGGIQLTVASVTDSQVVHCANGVKLMADVLLSSLPDTVYCEHM